MRSLRSSAAECRTVTFSCEVTAMNVRLIVLLAVLVPCRSGTGGAALSLGRREGQCRMARHAAAAPTAKKVEQRKSAAASSKPRRCRMRCSRRSKIFRSRCCTSDCGEGCAKAARTCCEARHSVTGKTRRIRRSRRFKKADQAACEVPVLFVGRKQLKGYLGKRLEQRARQRRLSAHQPMPGMLRRNPAAAAAPSRQSARPRCCRRTTCQRTSAPAQ